jgi:glycosyltransferase involved in cell wall biosynthesis
VVARQIRSALDELGHETFVLARPTRAKNIMPAFIDHSGVWDQPNVTDASEYRIPAEEMVAWGRANELDAALFDQNYEFDSIAALRESGVRTIGRFVWEQFASDNVEDAKRALNVVYSMTACEQERYASMGIDSPRVRWGIHPDLLAYADTPKRPALTYFYPAGFLSRRKPVAEILKAFRGLDRDDARLLIKGQVERELDTIDRGARRDPRVEVVIEDLPTEEHLRLFASAHVCVAPSRWEGLGLHLYESMALGLPVITNDNPPMNEIIRNAENGLLVASRRRGKANSGIPAYVPKVGSLRDAMRALSEPGRLEELQVGVEAARSRLAWSNTVEDYRALLA